MANSITCVRAPLSIKKIQKIYDKLSLIYDFLTRYENEAQRKALLIINVEEGAKVLEVGFGTGKTLIELVQNVAKNGSVYGIDISQEMVNKVKKKINQQKISNCTNLVLGEAQNIPFSNSHFDIVFCSYMLDLIDTPNIPHVLVEFKRVLKRRGRLVLVSMSKGLKWWDNMKIYEWLYRIFPSLLGGCRPIITQPYLRELGFQILCSDFIHAGHLMPTEIILAQK